MAEYSGESGVREVVYLPSSSESGSLGESECRRLSDEVRSLMAELRRMAAGGHGAEGDQEIDQYLERLDGRERAVQRERAASGSTASSSVRSGSTAPPPGEIIGQELVKWHLAEGTPVQEAGRSMTEKEIAAMRDKYRIPVDVLLRPLKDGELATNPPHGWVAVHEHQFKCGLSFPLHPWVQNILSALGLAIAQVTPNMWKQLLGMYVIWELSGNGWPTYDEVLSLYKLSYSTKRFCSGAVTLSSRGKSVVTKLPTSTVHWRSTVCLAGGRWESRGDDLRQNVLGTFKPIGCAIAYFFLLLGI